MLQICLHYEEYCSTMSWAPRDHQESKFAYKSKKPLLWAQAQALWLSWMKETFLLYWNPFCREMSQQVSVKQLEKICIWRRSKSHDFGLAWWKTSLSLYFEDNKRKFEILSSWLNSEYSVLCQFYLNSKPMKSQCSNILLVKFASHTVPYKINIQDQCPFKLSYFFDC